MENWILAYRCNKIDVLCKNYIFHLYRAHLSCDHIFQTFPPVEWKCWIQIAANKTRLLLCDTSVVYQGLELQQPWSNVIQHIQKVLCALCEMGIWCYQKTPKLPNPYTHALNRYFWYFDPHRNCPSTPKLGGVYLSFWCVLTRLAHLS